MGRLIFATSHNEESDAAAERRWENEGGSPGQPQQVYCDEGKKGATTGPAEGALRHSVAKVNRTCT